MNDEQPTPTVYVVDDDDGVRQALSFLLRSVDRACETFASGTQFLAGDHSSRPGCVVADLRMPDMSGLELQRRLTERGSSLPVVFITAHGDVPSAVDALKGGAIDFLQKPFRDQELLDRIDQALARNQVARRQDAGRKQIETRLETLTKREREVMHLVADGLSNRRIAEQLGVSQRTVEIHRARVMRKMEADSLAALVKMVTELDDTPSAPESRSTFVP